MIAFDVSVLATGQHEMSFSVSVCFLKIIQSIVSDLKSYLTQKKREAEALECELAELMLTTDYLGENVAQYNTQSVDYTMFLQSQYITLPRLKHYLENLANTGYELGIYGLFRAGSMLRDLLHSPLIQNDSTDASAKEQFDSSLERIDCLVEDILRNLVDLHQDNNEILFSSKVLQLSERLKGAVKEEGLGPCIVFVERIYTAAMLSQILTYLSEKVPSDSQGTLRIKYLTGQRASVGEVPMTAKYQV